MKHENHAAWLINLSSCCQSVGKDDFLRYEGRSLLKIHLIVIPAKKDIKSILKINSVISESVHRVEER